MDHAPARSLCSPTESAASINGCPERYGKTIIKGLDSANTQFVLFSPLQTRKAIQLLSFCTSGKAIRFLVSIPTIMCFRKRYVYTVCGHSIVGTLVRACQSTGRDLESCFRIQHHAIQTIFIHELCFECRLRREMLLAALKA